MAIESPIAIIILSRLPGSEVATAAFLIMMGLALWIESPVIDMLSTSTTLARNHDDVLVIRRFVLLVIGLVTAVHAIVAFSPLFMLFTRDVMGVPEPVAVQAHLGFRIMVFWSACIGWRRYLQGILIRYGKTKRIGAGTFVRMATMAMSGALLFLNTSLPSIEIAAIALMCSVFGEVAYVHFAAMPILRKLELEDPTPENTSPLDLRRLFKFHMPLTATTAMMMLGTPLVGAALSRADNSILQLAGWQVALSIVWLHRTVVYALPEVVITLFRDEQSRAALRKFSITVGFITSAALLVTAFTGLDLWLFTNVLRAKTDVANVAHIALLACAALPFIGALQSYLRGMLTAYHLTGARFLAVIVAMVCLCALLSLSVALGVAGVLSAAAAQTLALIAELFALRFAWRRGRDVAAAQVAIG